SGWRFSNPVLGQMDQPARRSTAHVVTLDRVQASLTFRAPGRNRDRITKGTTVRWPNCFPPSSRRGTIAVMASALPNDRKNRFDAAITYAVLFSGWGLDRSHTFPRPPGLWQSASW